VYCVWLAFELGFMLVYLIETKGRTLEETAALFDGDDKVDELHARAAADAGLTGGEVRHGKTPSLDEKGGLDEHIERS